jgi:cation transport protein ChaC
LISYAYHEVTISITLADGTDVDAVTYVINREGAQYCGNLDLETQATIIARAHGTRGPNRDYLFATVDHLAEMGVDDQDLRALARMVQALPE